jgi:SAM-dependent methyltransferase
MKNKDKWRSSKYVYQKGKLKASRDISEVNIYSRLITDIVAEFYHSNLENVAKGRLLDLGCGKAPLYEAYKNYINDNICVDWDKSFHENIYLDKCVNLNKILPFDNCEFDTIILSDVLEHIQNPKLLWDEMSRILKKDGKLIMNVPFFYGLHEEPFDYYRYTKHTLSNMAINSGFKVDTLTELGGLPEIFADLNAKVFSQIPIIGKLTANILQRLTWHFIHIKIGKKISKITSKKFPISYALIATKL